MTLGTFKDFDRSMYKKRPRGRPRHIKQVQEDVKAKNYESTMKEMVLSRRKL